MATEAEKKAAEAAEAKAAEAKAAEAKAKQEADEAKAKQEAAEAAEAKAEDVNVDDLIADRFVPVNLTKEDVVTDATVDGSHDVLGRPPGIYADVENAKLQEAQNAAREGRKPKEAYVPFHGSPREVIEAYTEANGG